MLKSPKGELALRALIAGAAAFFVSLGASPALDRNAIVGAATAAAMAFAEIFTPLNRLVGAFKRQGGTVSIDVESVDKALDELVGRDVLARYERLLKEVVH